MCRSGRFSEAAKYLTLDGYDQLDIRSCKLSKHQCHQESNRLMEEYPFALCMPMTGRSLRNVIQTQRFAAKPLKELAKILKDIAISLQSLHDDGLVHGNVNSEHVLCGEDDFKFIDSNMTFGVESLITVHIGKKGDSWNLDLGRSERYEGMVLKSFDNVNVLGKQYNPKLPKGTYFCNLTFDFIPIELCIAVQLAFL